MNMKQQVADLLSGLSWSAAVRRRTFGPGMKIATVPWGKDESITVTAHESVLQEINELAKLSIALARDQEERDQNVAFELRQGAAEIERLRRENEVLAAKVSVIDVFRAATVAQDPNRHGCAQLDRAFHLRALADAINPNRSFPTP